MLTSLIGTAASVAGSLIGGYHAAKAMRKARKMIHDQQVNNQNWFDRRMNQDYTQTAEAQEAMRRTRQYADDLIRRAEGRNVVMGGTDNALVAARQQAASMVGNTAATIAASAQQAKDNVEQQYRQNQQALQQQRINLYKEKAKQIAGASTFI